MNLIKRLAAVAVLSCTAAAAFAQEAVNVVGLFALSGPAAVYGVPTEKAFRMMVENNKTIAGHPVKLTIYDTEGSATKAAQLLRRAVENDDAHIVFGPSTSGETVAIMPIASQLKIAVFCHGAAEALTKPINPYIFSMAPTDRLMVEALMDDVKKRGGKKVALMYSLDALGQSALAVAEQIAPAKGLELVTESFASQDTNVTPQLLRLRDKKPDAIIIQAFVPGPTIVAKNAKELGMQTPMYLTTAASTLTYVQQTGAAAEGLLATTLPVVAPEAIPDGDPRKAVLVKFAKQFTEKYNLAPDQGAGLGLDDFLILEAAVKNVKGPITRESMRNALETVKICGANGCRQITATDHRGIGPDSMIVMRIKGGKFVSAN